MTPCAPRFSKERRSPPRPDVWRSCSPGRLFPFCWRSAGSAGRELARSGPFARDPERQIAHRINNPMPDRKQYGLWRSLSLIALAGLVFASGCTTTKISTINNDPASYMTKDVTVAGQVVTSYGASFGTLSQGAFELDDGTGRLWVWSSGFG